MLNVVMKNHVYQYNNQKRLQKEGGATGLNLTGELGDLYLVW